MFLQVGDPVAQPHVLLLQLPLLSRQDPQVALGSSTLSQLSLQSPLYAGQVCSEKKIFQIIIFMISL